VFKNDIVYTKFLDDGDLIKFENILASSYGFLRGMITALVNFEKLAASLKNCTNANIFQERVTLLLETDEFKYACVEDKTLKALVRFNE
jgi:hypothetical protein